MSAFSISDKHFSVIAHYVADNTGINPQIIADKLKRINIESVNHRYTEKTRFIRDKTAVYIEIDAIELARVKLHDKTAEYSEIDIIKLIQCWRYQSCENTLSLDFIMMDTLLLSYFNHAQFEQSTVYPKVWSI
jgi:hypothetical protein